MTHTPPIQTPNTGGKNCFLNDYTFAFIVTMVFLLGLLDITISSKPEGTWEGGREGTELAICRKVAELAPMGGSIEVWGDGYKLVPSCSLTNALKQLDG